MFKFANKTIPGLRPMSFQSNEPISRNRFLANKYFKMYKI